MLRARQMSFGVFGSELFQLSGRNRVIAMQTKMKYVWNTDGANETELRDAAAVKRDIALMMMKGCNIKKLKSEMRKLSTMNAAIL